MYMTKGLFMQLLREQQSSGLSVVAYCQFQSISPSVFYYWKRKCGDSKSNHNHVGSSSTTNPSKAANLVPIQVHKSSSSTSRCSVGNGVLIQLPNGVQVEFAVSNDSVAIQMLNTICSRYV